MLDQLSATQRELVSSLSTRLASIRGVAAVVLGGSYARGRAQPGSDIDLGLLYSEADPFEVESIRQLAAVVNDTADPVVTGFYGWGPWVNGGAWLTIGGQRVDFIYRNIEHVGRVIDEAQAGRYELDYLQQPPFGFFGPTYLGEIAVCIPLFDPAARLEGLKRRVSVYPERLRQAVVRDHLWMAEFTLGAFAPRFAARSDTHGTATCLTRATNHLVLALFALDRTYPLNDKTALAEIATFERAPRDFGPRLNDLFACLGASVAELGAAVERVGQLLRETIELADGLYQPRFALPKGTTNTDYADGASHRR
jgi:predicted nucleotidyltransferase